MFSDKLALTLEILLRTFLCAFLEKYLNIPNATLSLIENGKQPMREIHVQKITNFFDVTSDYLLGYSNTGIGIYFASSEDDNDHEYISASELEKLKELQNR